VNPDLVVRDGEDKPFTVRYDAVNVMLLNEFLKAHDQIEEYASIIAQQEEEIRVLRKIVRERAARLRKVSEQVDVRASPARLAAND
jgi:hypothetical protein